MNKTVLERRAKIEAAVMTRFCVETALAKKPVHPMAHCKPTLLKVHRSNLLTARRHFGLCDRWGGPL